MHVDDALARVPERVERPGLGERLDGALVQRAAVDPVAEVEEVDERPTFLARPHDVRDDPFADVAHGGEAVPDGLAAVGVGSHREVLVGLVDVGDEHRDAAAAGTR